MTKDKALNVASQCLATASAPLCKNILVDGGSGLLSELLSDAAKAIEALAQPVQPAIHSQYGSPEMQSLILDKLAQAQPVQEPETFERWNAKQHGDPEEIGFLQALRIAYCAGQNSVTTPPAPQRPWVGLTDEDVKNLELTSATSSDVRDISAELKEKNHG